MRFFRENQIELLKWPAQSPDLNPIENLWVFLKSKFKNESFQQKLDLIKKNRKIWKKLRKPKQRNWF